MSLLEDIFLQDEANEAQELERIIEGEEFEERPRSDSDDNSEKEDEAEEDKRKVDPASTKTRRVIKNPRFILNPARLSGPRGIQVIPDHFKDFKFKGKGHEKEDLDLVLKKLEHWAYRLYPKFKFEDCLKKIETLGKKRPVMVHLHKIRTDQYLTEDTVVQKDSSDEETTEVEPQDEFDKLLQQQIELARSTPAPNSAKKGFDNIVENQPLIMPKATSSPSISDEQKERMLRNRKLAEERRLARLKAISNANLNNSQAIIQEESVSVDEVGNNIMNNENEVILKKNRSNVIVSSDEEDAVVNESITADIHVTKERNNINMEETVSEVNENNDNSINNEENDKQTDIDTDEVFDNIVDGKNQNVNEIDENIEANENTKTHEDTEANENMNTQEHNEANENMKTHNSTEVNKNNEVTCNSDIVAENVKNVSEQNDNVDDLMDVDFGDDF